MAQHTKALTHFLYLIIQTFPWEQRFSITFSFQIQVTALSKMPCCMLCSKKNCFTRYGL